MPIRQMESSEQHLVIKSPMPTKNKGRRRGRGGRKLGQCDQFSSRSTIEHQIQDGGLVGDIETGFPSSNNSLRFLARPGFGQAGTRCIVKANHFLTELPDKDLHHYDVKITPEVTLKSVNGSIIQELVKLYKDSDLGMRLPAYDGMKSLYTAGELPFSYREFDVKIVDKNDGDGHQRREREYKVTIKFVARANLHHLGQFLDGKRADAPQATLHVLDIVLRELSTQRSLSKNMNLSDFY